MPAVTVSCDRSHGQLRASPRTTDSARSAGAADESAPNSRGLPGVVRYAPTGWAVAALEMVYLHESERSSWISAVWRGTCFPLQRIL